MSKDDFNEIALEALKVSTVALTKIEDHEDTCGKRWGIVVKIGYMMFATMLSVLGVLLQDKFF